MAGSNGQHNARDWAGKRIFTTGEAAEICKVSQQTIIRCFDAGRLGGFRVPGSKFRRIPRAELIKFMRANDIPVGALDQGARRVLVVDDDKQIIEMFKDLFARNDRYDVRFCSTGYDAGLMTEQFRPNVIILDYMLPDVNGNVVCRRIREHDELKDTRIIFVSGVVNPEEIDSLKAAGADDFVRKPFDVGALLKRIDELTEAA
jgi:excisionase family DNA binding protein